MWSLGRGEAGLVADRCSENLLRSIQTYCDLCVRTVRMTGARVQTQTTLQLSWQWRRSGLCFRSCWWRVMSACAPTHHMDTVVSVSSDEFLFVHFIWREVHITAHVRIFSLLSFVLLIFVLQVSWTMTVRWIMTPAACAWQKWHWPTLELVNLVFRVFCSWSRKTVIKRTVYYKIKIFPFLLVVFKALKNSMAVCLQKSWPGCWR